MTRRFSGRLATWLGRWYGLATGVVSTLVFLVWVPREVAGVTDHGRRGTKILDQYYPTWTKSDAADLMGGLGAAGRHAYVHYYVTFDYWIPMLTLTIFCVAALSVIFPPTGRFWWFNLLPLPMYLFDVVENTNHIVMAEAWPVRPALAWNLGPLWSLGKYGLMTVCIALMLIGIASRVRVPARFAARE